ncbi:MAG: haloacid dehalogenase-like hydrolase [Elusimicrobiales bacterium]|nr:haloacid dehalogenase-like hydrolase [Elusimicrobiales bacterium]
MHKLVLFDLDGTLVLAGGSGKLALNAAVEKLYGKKNVCSEFSLAGCTDNANFSRAHELAAGEKAKTGDVARIAAAYLKILPVEVKKAVREKRYSKIRGVEKFIAALKKHKNVLVGLGTGNLKEGAFIKLGPSGMTGEFVCGGFGCDGYHRADVLRKAVRRAEKIAGRKISPAEVYIVGDTPLDISAGKECGYRTGVVTCGYSPRGELLRAGPELLEKDFSDMKPWLVWLGLCKDPKGARHASYMFPDCAIEHVQFGRTGVDSEQLKLLRRVKANARGKKLA